MIVRSITTTPERSGTSSNVQYYKSKKKTSWYLPTEIQETRTATTQRDYLIANKLLRKKNRKNKLYLEKLLKKSTEKYLSLRMRKKSYECGKKSYPKSRVKNDRLVVRTHRTSIITSDSQKKMGNSKCKLLMNINNLKHKTNLSSKPNSIV
jgi:hypothetical protein